MRPLPKKTLSLNPQKNLRWQRYNRPLSLRSKPMASRHDPFSPLPPLHMNTPEKQQEIDSDNAWAAKTRTIGEIVEHLKKAWNEPDAEVWIETTDGRREPVKSCTMGPGGSMVISAIPKFRTSDA